ncbi:hypothetical protein CHU_3493 [Cytophaga hutchinsonii ATCC 33406]|uniref:Lipoprotein n=2 Tax=Cytophaga hutchinsonii TaxID=985 RepID=A0A6N4SWE8_CYTH3|nr:hypothetical protein CHU_3493 [Cytophaga hutchinsonii ATCC 33406]
MYMKNAVWYVMLTLLFFFSCAPMNRTIGMRQVYQYPEIKNNTKPLLPDLTKILSVPLQSFTVDTHSDTILYGIEGTILFINPVCLNFSSGVPQKKITVELKELYTKAALLKERAYTISNGRMLESDGSIYVHAYAENGEAIEITCENALRIRLPREVQENMIYFQGKRNDKGNMNWEVDGSIAPIYEETGYDFVAEEDEPIEISQTEAVLHTYFFSIQKFGWINCDRFYDDMRTKTDFIATFRLPVSEKKVVQVHNYIVFDSLMSIIPLENDLSGQWVCPNLPIGAAVTCISIQKTDTHLYYGSKKTRVGDRESSIIPLNEIKEADLIKLLDLSL